MHVPVESSGETVCVVSEDMGLSVAELVVGDDDSCRGAMYGADDDDACG